MKKTIATLFTLTIILSTVLSIPVDAATKTKAQIKKACKAKYETVMKSYESKIKHGYASTVDINGDGINELIINDCSSAATSEMYSIVYAYNKKTNKLTKTQTSHLIYSVGNGYVAAGCTYQDDLYKMTSSGKLKHIGCAAGGSLAAEDPTYKASLNGKDVSNEKFYSIITKNCKIEQYKYSVKEYN